MIDERAKLYRGTSARERQAARREQLIRAAITVYGATGYRNATVKTVCETAGLTERYFYESFANSEALLIASFEAVNATYGQAIDAATREELAPEARVRAMLRAYYAALQADPASARVFIVEIGGISPAVDAVARQALRRFADRLTAAWGAETSAIGEIVRVGVVGAIIHIALAWIANGFRWPLQDVVDKAFRICAVMTDARPRKD